MRIARVMSVVLVLALALGVARRSTTAAEPDAPAFVLHVRGAGLTDLDLSLADLKAMKHQRLSVQDKEGKPVEGVWRIWSEQQSAGKAAHGFAGFLNMSEDHGELIMRIRVSRARFDRFPEEIFGLGPQALPA